MAKVTLAGDLKLAKKKYGALAWIDERPSAPLKSEIDAAILRRREIVAERDALAASLKEWRSHTAHQDLLAAAEAVLKEDGGAMERLRIETERSRLVVDAIERRSVLYREQEECGKKHGLVRRFQVFYRKNAGDFGSYLGPAADSLEELVASLEKEGDS